MSALDNSEAETEILSSSSEEPRGAGGNEERVRLRKRRRRGRKQVELLRETKRVVGSESDRDDEEYEEEEDGAGVETPGSRRRRKRFRSTSSEESDAVFSSSDLSSAQSSPRGRKRKMEEDDGEEDVGRKAGPVRKRRGGLDSAGDHQHRTSTKTKGTQAGRRTAAAAQPPTSRRRRQRTNNRNDNDSDDDSNDQEEEEADEEDNSGEESISPARRSVARRTPGSPSVNNIMQHRRKRDTAGRTYLHKACGKGNVAEVQQILQQSLDLIDAEDNAGYLPIHEASLHGHLEVVKMLVDHGSSYDLQSSVDQESPLHDAVENGHLDVVKYLLQLGADPRRRDKQGRSCIDTVEENAHENVPEEVREELQEILKVAAKKFATQRPSTDDETANRASVPAADSYSSRDPSVGRETRQSPTTATAPGPRVRRNARAEQSRKDLLWLDSGKGPVVKLREKAREGDYTMVYSLLETGLVPDTATLVGAIKGGHHDLVSLLLAYAAQADPVPGQLGSETSRKKREVSMSQCEETPMLAAIGRGNIQILELLLSNGVDPTRLDSQGKSYAQIAAEREGENWEDEVELLEKAAAEAVSKSAASAEKGRKEQKQTKSPRKERIRASNTATSTNNPNSSATSANIPKEQQRTRRNSTTSLRARNQKSSPPPPLPPTEKKGERLARKQERLPRSPQQQRLRSSSGASAVPPLGLDNTEHASRRSPSAGSRPRSRPRPVTTSLVKDDARKSNFSSNSKSDSRRSRSASSFHHLDDTSVASDPESATEPLGPPKNRAAATSAVTKQQGDTLAPGSPSRRRRRLVSGKERDEEKAMSRTGNPARSRDSDTERRPPASAPRQATEKSNKGRSDVDDNTNNPSRKLKVEPSEDVKMDDAPPYDRRKMKPDRERERQGSIRPNDTRDPKRPSYNHDRSRSPRRLPKDRHEPEAYRKRRRDESLDDRPARRRDSVVSVDRRSRDGSRPTGEKLKAGKEDTHRKQDIVRSAPRDPPGHDDERQRRKEQDAKRETKTKEVEDKPGSKSQFNAKAPETKSDKAREIKSKHEEPSDDAILEAEAKELVRRKHLTKELGSILQKARVESQKAKESDIITRELELRRIRRIHEEENHKREQEEREMEQQAPADSEPTPMEGIIHDVEAERDPQDQSRERQEHEARQRAERDALEAASRERERQAAESAAKKEEQRIEEERKAVVQAEAERTRLAAEDETRRREAERLVNIRKAEEAEVARAAKAADEERKRCEVEKAAQDLRERRMAEELQAQLADAARKRAETEQRKADITNLPYNLRILAEKEMQGDTLAPQPQFLPWLAGRISTGNSFSVPGANGVTGKERPLWATNVQASLAFGIPDLNLSAHPDLVRHPASDSDRIRIWTVMNSLLCKDLRYSDIPMNERVDILNAEREKFLKLKPVFWIKLDSLWPLIDAFPALRERGHCVTEISLGTHTLGIPKMSKEEMAKAKAKAGNAIATPTPPP